MFKSSVSRGPGDGNESYNTKKPKELVGTYTNF